MVDIRPFCGFIYNPNKFHDYSPILAPPYDVISPSQREKLMVKSPYNIVNLILGKRDSFGNMEKNFYTRAGMLWNKWRNERIIIQTKKPGIWVIRETFSTSNDKIFTRCGFIALIKLEDYSSTGIQRHERTLNYPRLDRFQLMKSTRANLSPVFFIYSDENGQGELILNKVDGEITQSKLDYDGSVQIKSFRIENKEVIDELVNLMTRKPVVIADGHHRYETALAFHKKYSSHFNTAYVLGYFISSASNGLMIFPTHRGVNNLKNFTIPEFLSKCQEHFIIINESDDSSSIDDSLPSFKCALNNNDVFKFYLKPGTYDRLKSSLTPPELASFDVVVLEKIIFREILELTSEEINSKNYVKYYHWDIECMNDLKNKRIQCAFLLDAIPIDALIHLSTKGGILPQKSTYFYPKVPVGLVMHSLERS